MKATGQSSWLFRCLIGAFQKQRRDVINYNLHSFTAECWLVDCITGRLLIGCAVRSGWRAVCSDSVHESGRETRKADTGDGHRRQRHHWYPCKHISNSSSSSSSSDRETDTDDHCESCPATSERPDEHAILWEVQLQYTVDAECCRRR